VVLRYLLAAVPIVMLVFALPLVNRTDPHVLGLPFLLFWICAWVLVTPLFMGAVFYLDRSRREPEPE
jgi:Protein of unknown function (DUF3311)